MIAFLQWRRHLRTRFAAEHLLVHADHLLGVLVGSHAHDAILVAKEVASEMIRDRSSTLQLEFVLIHEDICDTLGIFRTPELDFFGIPFLRLMEGVDSISVSRTPFGKFSTSAASSRSSK